MRLCSKVLLLFTWCGLSACSPDTPATLAPSHPLAAAPAAQTDSTPMAGSWTPTDPFSPDVQEAARFAVQTFAVQNKARVLFKEVTQARLQVVAGLNFQLQLQVTLDGAPRNVSVTVWRQLDGDYFLQSWDWVD
jgi:hypothetical protein